MLWLTGEPGIGKTAVIEAFAMQASQGSAAWVAVGQCIEHYGPGEPEEQFTITPPPFLSIC